MDGRLSGLSDLNWQICGQLCVWLVLIFAARLSDAYTNPGDVAAINSLYVALGSPLLPGWVGVGGDPCADSWQGVQCIDSNISAIIFNAANLGGELGDSLGSFASIRSIDFSGNQIGGNIPSSLPVTLQNLFLSANKFTGSIPSSLSSLSQLSAMSLDNNQLTGEIPDSFQGLTVLVNLDLSANNLSGQLPPSVESLSSLMTFHLQNNQLSGTLDVLQDLPLRDLNVANNMFSGPIPEKLLSIPKFTNDGNPFNTSDSPVSPLSPPSPLPGSRPPAPPFFGVPSSGQTPGKQRPAKQTPSKPADGPSATEESNSKRTGKTNTKKIVWISIASVLFLAILVLLLLLFIPRLCRRSHEANRIPKRHEIAPYTGNRENMGDNESLIQPINQIPKVPAVKSKEEQPTRPRTMEWAAKPKREEFNVQRTSQTTKPDDYETDLTRFDMDIIKPPPPPPSPPPPPPPPLTFDKVIVRPIPAAEIPEKPSTRPLPLTSVRCYTVASLQQYTNSFSQENLIGEGMLGSVYRAQLPTGKILAVKKLNKRASSQLSDDEFVDMVNSIDKIRHANVVELMGYCAEHGQKLLIYEYCGNGTLQDALHADDEFKKRLLWNTRIRMALGAARALEYLHDFCEPPIIHRNFKSANILLDDDLAVHVSECGLAPLVSTGSVSQLSGNLLSAYGYGAPEFESGIYTSMSDVYSFGVVMLELLTGRKSYDRTRTRGEQFLVRWAVPQLHDIDALSGMVDPSLNGEYPAKSLSHFADIILRCVQAEPEFRPPMSEVVQDLIQVIRRE
ncbi:hypothetical protein ACET3Z_016552 [Daucus carota]